jgi:hypothetical protein
MMTLTFDLAFEDLLEFTYYTNWSRPSKLGYRIASSLLPLTVLLVMMYFAKGLNFSLYGIGEIIFIALGISLFFLMPSFVRMGCSNSLRRQLEKHNNKSPIGWISLIFTEDQVEGKTENICSVMLWSAFECLEEDQKYFFLFQTYNQAIVIPKHAFSSNIEIDNLRLLIKKQLSASSTGNFNP